MAVLDGGSAEQGRLNMKTYKAGLNYRDVHLVPEYSELASREHADTFIDFGRFTFKLPVVPANMVSCIDTVKADWLSANGYIYILHRFMPYGDIVTWAKGKEKSGQESMVSISVGIKQRDRELLNALAFSGSRLDYVTVDVAHGDHAEAHKMLSFIANLKISTWPELFIIGGNVATGEAFTRMAPFVDAVKVGIALGGACTTYNKTGFASPMFSAILEASAARSALPSSVKPVIIADGGISCNGDITKALVAGADMVMCGSVFARCMDSPALVDPTDPTRKLYFGSASSMSGNRKNIEGKTVAMSINGMTYAQKLCEIREDLASSISYAGGTSLEAFRKVCWGIHKN